MSDPMENIVNNWKLNFKEDDLEDKSVFFTADHHFGHEAIIGYCDRPFINTHVMNKKMTERWNEKVGKDDIVFHLGDFTLNSYVQAETYLSKLNGRIFFVPGGHDKKWLRGLKPHTNIVEIDGKEKAKILSPLVTVDFPNECFVLCHYAMHIWDRKHYGAKHLFGHSHGNFEGVDSSMDVGVDTNNFSLYTFDSVKKILER